MSYLRLGNPGTYFISVESMSAGTEKLLLLILIFNQMNNQITQMFLHNNENLPCASWRPRISLFTCSNMQTACANQAYRKKDNSLVKC